MQPQRVEELKQEYTGRDVTVDAGRPELARFEGLLGRVRSINHNGRALVQFEGADVSWYDIELDYLKVVEPEPEPTGPETAEPEDESPPEEQLSRLELARMEKQAQEEQASAATKGGDLDG